MCLALNLALTGGKLEDPKALDRLTHGADKEAALCTVPGEQVEFSTWSLGAE